LYLGQAHREQIMAIGRSREEEHAVLIAERFVVRRCESFYPIWHDVSDHVSLLQAQEIYDRLTYHGTRNTAPGDIVCYNIFPADPLPEWPDASRPLIRQLCARDSQAIEAHLLNLNPADRRLRFFNMASDDQIRAYVKNIDWHCSLLLGAVFGDVIIGLSEAFFDRVVPTRHAEIAVSVDLALRGRGLGCFLVRHVIARAALRGARRTSLCFLRENQPIQRIIRRLGGTLDMEDLVGLIPMKMGNDMENHLAA
jgi:RimJ/RimL family protein N-acetyltransferase